MEDYSTCGRKYKKSSWLRVGPDMVPGPEFCPDAVIRYLALGRGDKKHQESVAVDVRKHILHLHWKLDYIRQQGRIKLRYTSPDGKLYYSLRQVCLILSGDENRSPLRTTSKKVILSRDENGTPLRTARKRVILSQDENGSSLKTRSKRVKQVAVPKKPLTILSWLIDNNIVLPRAKVHFVNSTGGGRITREGIKCNCCCKLYTLTGFTFHVTGFKFHSTARICLQDGTSLLDCLKKIVDKDMANFMEEEAPGNFNDENDVICSVCLYGGELLLCDHCPSSFHKSCLGLVDFPEGDWFCPSCCCKICGRNRLKADAQSSTEEDAFLNCTQCQRKYHIWCLWYSGNSCLKSVPGGNWFCTKKCEKIFSGLNELIGKPIPVGLGSDNLTWTLLKPSYHKLDAFNNEASWIENCSKLNIAVEIMHECFEPVEEPHTKSDLVRDVIFNKRSELKRRSFGGFYTVILQKGDEFISVAIIRVYGEKVAELPLVGTRFQYRRLGMCRVLMNLLEKKLMNLGVERLILPAVPSVLNAWTGSFGFSKLTVSEILQFVDYTFLNFPDTVMCQKQLIKVPCAESREVVPRRCDTIELEGSIAVSKGHIDRGIMVYARKRRRFHGTIREWGFDDFFPLNFASNG
ncbi:increased DNA methylation 1-like [Euphorbia lathyris]|uniref:increased DNA methylation 1-like n=1 Tax=Euphorbia lathyris TaxID=212925 RepID=UPI003313374E